MHKRTLLLGGALGLMAALAGTSTTQPSNTQNLGSRLKRLASQEVAIEKSLTRPTKQAPAKPASSAPKVQLAVRSLPLIELGNPLRLPQHPVRRRVKYGRHRWVVLG